MLPAGLTHLELECRCSGPLPAALQHFTGLQELSLTGNGAEVDWACRGGAAALAKLTRLCLDCRLPDYEMHGSGDNPLIELIPMGRTTDLPRQLREGLLAAPTPRLRWVQLVCSFGDSVVQLCRGLAQQGGLRELRCAACACAQLWILFVLVCEVPAGRDHSHSARSCALSKWPCLAAQHDMHELCCTACCCVAESLDLGFPNSCQLAGGPSFLAASTMLCTAASGSGCGMMNAHDNPC